MASVSKTYIRTSLLYGGMNLSSDLTGRYFVSESEEGKGESLMAKLLFPHAYELGEQDKQEYYPSVWEGTHYSADEIIKPFRSEGINLLQRKYECDDVEFFRQLKS